MSYSDVLAVAHGHGPRAVELLMDSEQLRVVRLHQLVTGWPPALGAYHELFEHLDDIAGALREDDCEAVAQVVIAARWDAEMCLEATLSGRPAVCADRCRHLMEIEVLLHEFAAHPERVTEWEHADDKVIRKKFSHAALRDKMAKRQGLPEEMRTADFFEYGQHSRLLHLSPGGVQAGGFEGADDESHLQHLMAETFGHVLRLMLPLNAFLGTRPNLRDKPPHDVMPATLGEVLDAYNEMAIEAQRKLGIEPRGSYHKDYQPNVSQV